MLVVTSRIEVRPTARRELAQALLQWVNTVRRVNDTAAHLYEDQEPPHAFCVVSTWPTAEALARHLAAPEFGSLVGAVELLASDSTVLIAEARNGVPGLPELRRLCVSGPPASHDQ